MSSGRKAKELRRRQQQQTPANVSAQLQYTRTEGFNSPFPSAHELRQLYEIVPDGAESVFALLEKQTAHRQQLEAITIKGDASRANWGLGAGFAVALAFLFASVYLISGKHEIAGGIIGTVDLVALVSVFVYGSASRRQERENKNQQRIESAERMANRRKH